MRSVDRVTELFRHLRRRYPWVDDESQLGAVPQQLALHGGEFCLSARIDAAMVAAVCRHGYLPMAQLVLGVPILLIKLHEFRCVLDFTAVRVPRSTRRRARGTYLLAEGEVGSTLRAIERAHDDSWIIPPLSAALDELHRSPRGGVSVHAFTLRTDVDVGAEILAGEIGYAVGAVYTSLSGYRLRSGAGMVQLAALAGLLADYGYAFWDLGMEVRYKLDLGARLVERATFLERYRRAAAEMPRIALFESGHRRPVNPLSAGELLTGR